MSESPASWGGAGTPPRVKYGLFASWPGREGALPAFDYFRDRADEIGAREAIEKARADGRAIVGVLCTFIPEELILALNAVPLRVCVGTGPGELRGDLPRDACPVIQAALQRLGTETLDALVVPTTCDWKVHAVDRVAHRLPVFRVELPRSEEPDGLIRELRDLTDELADITDFSLTAASLRDALAVTAAAHKAHRDVEALRRTAEPPMSGCEAMLIADAYGYGDIAGWTAACEELCAALPAERTRSSGDRRPRLLLAGSPIIWPNFKVPSLVENTGGVVVGDDFCSRASRLAWPDVPPGSLRDMLEGLARRALEPCTCGMTPSAGARSRALLALVRELDADGVVCHYLRGCAPIAATQGPVVSALRGAGVPTLTLETEAGEEDIEGLRTRIEAFIEMTSEASASRRGARER